MQVPFSQQTFAGGMKGENGQHRRPDPTGLKDIVNFRIDRSGSLRQVPGTTAVPVEIRKADKVLTFEHNRRVYTVVYDTVLKRRFCNPEGTRGPIQDAASRTKVAGSTRMGGDARQNRFATSAGNVSVANASAPGYVAEDFPRIWFPFRYPNLGSLDAYRAMGQDTVDVTPGSIARASDAIHSFVRHASLAGAYPLTLAGISPVLDAQVNPDLSGSYPVNIYRVMDKYVEYMRSYANDTVAGRHPSVGELYANSYSLHVDMGYDSMYYNRFLVYDDNWRLLNSCVYRPQLVEEDSGEGRLGTEPTGTGRLSRSFYLEDRPLTADSSPLLKEKHRLGEVFFPEATRLAEWGVSEDTYIPVPREHDVLFYSASGKLPVLVARIGAQSALVFDQRLAAVNPTNVLETLDARASGMDETRAYLQEGAPDPKAAWDELVYNSQYYDRQWPVGIFAHANDLSAGERLSRYGTPAREDTDQSPAEMFIRDTETTGNARVGYMVWYQAASSQVRNPSQLVFANKYVERLGTRQLLDDIEKTSTVFSTGPFLKDSLYGRYPLDGDLKTTPTRYLEAQKAGVTDNTLTLVTPGKDDAIAYDTVPAAFDSGEGMVWHHALAETLARPTASVGTPLDDGASVPRNLWQYHVPDATLEHIRTLLSNTVFPLFNGHHVIQSRRTLDYDAEGTRVGMNVWKIVEDLYPADNAWYNVFSLGVHADGDEWYQPPVRGVLLMDIGTSGTHFPLTHAIYRKAPFTRYDPRMDSTRLAANATNTLRVTYGQVPNKRAYEFRRFQAYPASAYPILLQPYQEKGTTSTNPFRTQPVITNPPVIHYDSLFKSVYSPLYGYNSKHGYVSAATVHGNRTLVAATGAHPETVMVSRVAPLWDTFATYRDFVAAYLGVDRDATWGFTQRLSAQGGERILWLDSTGDALLVRGRTRLLTAQGAGLSAVNQPVFTFSYPPLSLTPYAKIFDKRYLVTASGEDVFLQRRSREYESHLFYSAVTELAADYIGTGEGKVTALWGDDRTGLVAMLAGGTVYIGPVQAEDRTVNWSRLDLGTPVLGLHRYGDALALHTARGLEVWDVDGSAEYNLPTAWIEPFTPEVYGRGARDAAPEIPSAAYRIAGGKVYGKYGRMEVRDGSGALRSTLVRRDQTFETVTSPAGDHGVRLAFPGEGAILTGMSFNLER